MDESLENSVEQEVATPNIENVEAVSTQAQDPIESRQERNWKAMREKEREYQNQLKQQQEFIEKLLASQTAPKAVVEEEPELPDDEYVPVGKVKKITSKAVSAVEEKIRKLEEQLEQERVQKRFSSLITKYPDFEDVVNNDTLSLLEQEDPELAQTIADLKDPYKIGVQSYKYIKAMGLASKVPQARRVKEVEKKLEKNAQTVQSPLVYDKRPMAQAFRETEAEKAALYEEMIGFAQKASFGY